MFTGIVQGTAELVAIDSLPNFRTHVIRMPSPAWGEGLALGASVAHNGCCLTVTRVEGDLVSFDLMQETLRLTNLGQLVVGDKVNVERAARFGDEIGGHAMSGHIMGTAEVSAVTDCLRASLRERVILLSRRHRTERGPGVGRHIPSDIPYRRDVPTVTV
jgi:riboflavin synthase